MKWLSKSSVVLGLAAALFLSHSGKAYCQDWKLGVAFFPAKGGGLKIAKVFPNSPAKEMGLKPGYKIITIEGKLANDPLAAKKLIDAAGAKLTLIYHDGNQLTEVEAQLAVAAYITGKYSKVKNISKKKLTGSK